MAETDFASWDGTADHASQEYVKPTPPAAPARRSVSIFSRRGTDTPESDPSLATLAGMTRTPSRGLSTRQRNWLRQRRSDSTRSRNAKKTKGTILNAVPPMRTDRMTELEQEMATSPNEEILSAISEQPRHFQTLASSSFETLPTQTHSPDLGSRRLHWSPSTGSLMPKAGLNRRDDYNRIGVWVDGVTHWSGSMSSPPNSRQHSPKSSIGSQPILPVEVASTPQAKPCLSVSIPKFESLVSEPTFPNLGQIPSYRPDVSVAPATVISRFSVATHQPSQEALPISEVSPLQSGDVDSQQSLAHKISSNLTEDDSEVEIADSRHHRSSSSTASSSAEHDETSVYSKRSSATSIEVSQPSDPSKSEAGTLDKTPSVAFIVPNPADGGVFEEALGKAKNADVNKPLPPVPPPRLRPAPAPPTTTVAACARHSKNFRASPVVRKGDGVALRSMMPAANRSTSSLDKLDVYDAEFMRASPYPSGSSDLSSEVGSPTLSQAAGDLEVQLTTISEDDGGEKASVAANLKDATHVDASSKQHNGTEDRLKHAAIQRSDSVCSVMQPPSHVPTIPKRSRKREWFKGAHAQHIASQARRSVLRVPTRRRSESSLRSIESSYSATPATSVRRRHSLEAISHSKQLADLYAMELPGVADTCTEKEVVPFDDGLCVIAGPIILRPAALADPTTEKAAAVATAVAQGVLLHILGSLRSLNDLFNMALINKGMYRVFRENEMQLVRMVACNESPAGWELREWCPPTRSGDLTASSDCASQLEHDASSYASSLARDVEVMEQLKELMLDRTVMRHETASALSSPDDPNAQRFTNAFWRIWTFCTVFGSQKNREEDITGQLDWLKGGILANNHGSSATINASLDFEMTSVLLNAPEHFARGNTSGLTAEQLYDMTEIWTCLAALLSPYQGRLDQAREAGIFAQCDIAPGDLEQETNSLEEWVAYILTLGPSAILPLAQRASDPSPAGFEVARSQGWTVWRLSPHTSSRTTFLKEPVARLYEERIVAMTQPSPQNRAQKDNSRIRVQTLAAEIKLARQTSAYKRLPLIDMHSERPMSMCSRASSTATTRSERNQYQPRRAPPPLYLHPAFASPTSQNTSPSTSPSTSPNFSHPFPFPPQQSANGAWSPRHISPIIEERVDTFNRLSLTGKGGVAGVTGSFNGLPDSTAERAVKRVMDMGFSEDKAKRALRITDLGDGLRVDRAVELLLRET